jgi:hypothetical protein
VVFLLSESLLLPVFLAWSTAFCQTTRRVYTRLSAINYTQNAITITMLKNILKNVKIKKSNKKYRRGE